MTGFKEWWAEQYNQLDHRDILRSSELAWYAGFQEGFKMGMQVQHEPNKLKGLDYTCAVCGCDMTQPRGYCCTHQRCPGAIR